MVKGYVIAAGKVTNATQWALYAAAASEAIKQYGGNPLARGGQMTIAEGQGFARNVMQRHTNCARAQANLTSLLSKVCDA
jgi:uncharacterized protein (DUF1330 family)